MGNLTFNGVFSAVLNMSITASVMIGIILVVRLLLRKTPKLFSYILWSVVLFRLLCPISFTTDFSLLGLMDTSVAEVSPNTTIVEHIPAQPGNQTVVFPVTPGRVEAPDVTPSTPANPAAPASEPLTIEQLLPWIWATGILAMAIYSVVSLVKLRKQLLGATPLRDNIYLADYIGSPFVMGLFSPKIYLPSSLTESERRYILFHEQHHIRRGDHLIKALAFIALCIHWFNPLVWLAFVLSSKDMEMSCDEAVVKKLGAEIRTDYSASLLSLATGRRIIAGTPLAFGEGDTKSRIKNMLNWKKPAVWVSAVGVVVCITVVLGCAANPAETKDNTPDETPGNYEKDTPSDEPPPPSQADNGESTQGNDVNRPAQGTYGTATDGAYYLELASQQTDFRDMDDVRKAALLAEYGDLLAEYTLTARETANGTAAYIIGQFNGNPTKSPLNGMYSIELSFGEEDVFQFLYNEENAKTVEEILATNKNDFPPSVGYRIENSRVSWSSNGGVVLIQPKDAELLLDVAWSRYLYTPNGREYIADAVSRGIDVCGRTNTFLYVYLISEQYGEIAERIALTEAEAAAIQGEKLVSIEEGFGFSATLHIDGQTTYYNEHSGIPQTVLDLAVDRCGYKFANPSNITGDIVEASLDLAGFDSTLHADEADLPRLKEILKNAEFGYIGSCGYGAKLTLTLANGEKLVVFKGTDNCDSIAFGSYGGYFIGDKETIEFWEMFGLDPDTKVRVEPQAVNTSLFYRQGMQVAVSGVLSSRTETMLLDDGLTRHEYTVFTCVPGAEITVKSAGMSDPTYAEDGKPHAVWGLYYTNDDRIRITDETPVIPVTEGLEGIYNLEASLFVLRFELVSDTPLKN